jgi:hypothetical protein
MAKSYRESGVRAYFFNNTKQKKPDNYPLWKCPAFVDRKEENIKTYILTSTTLLC